MSEYKSGFDAGVAHAERMRYRIAILDSGDELPIAEIRGMRATRLGKRHESEPVIRTLDPQGREIFWIGPAGKAKDSGEGTDFHACANGMVSMRYDVRR